MFSDIYLASYSKKLSMNKAITFCLVFLCMGLKSYCQLSVDKHFSDHMVLQREQPVTLSGNAEPQAKVIINFGAIHLQTTTDTNGYWSVVLPKQKAQSKGVSLVVASKEEQITYDDILIGDIWLLIGQSNMEFELKGDMYYEEEKKKLHQPLLRFYNPTFGGKYIFNRQFKDSVLNLLTPEHFYSAVDWQVSDSSSAPSISAVGYYFARKIIDSVNVPIGLIHLAIGGAPIETFISTKALANSEFSKKIKGNWLYNDSLPDWIRERGQQNVGEKAIHSDQLGPNHGYKPGFAYDSGIKPLEDFPIRGILWYQGESNAQEIGRVMEYNKLQKLMLSELRALWKNPKLPFYYAQLSSIDTLRYNGQLWPIFRNEQRLFLNSTKKTGMAVSSDIGTKHDVHPKNKKTVGERLSLWALRDVYHFDCTVSGPLATKAVFKNKQIVIYFQSIGKGLSFKGAHLLGFYLDGKAVQAQIRGNTVVISAEQKPHKVAYGFASFSLGNLTNKEKLPASSFILDVQ